MAMAMVRPPISFARQPSDLTLEELLGEARDSFAAELAIPLTSTRPPLLTTKDGHGDVHREPTQAAQIGRSMSAPMVRRLGHPNGYGNTFPVARALDDLRGWCRGRHLEAASGPWIDHAADLVIPAAELQRPLCARLAWHAVVWRMQPAWSAHIEGLEVVRVDRLLHGALGHAWDQRRMWAHGDDSGATEVLAAQRRERRQARQRAADVAGPDIRCRYCGGPYDADSETPCPGSEGNQISEEEAKLYAELGVELLCSPAVPT